MYRPVGDTREANGLQQTPAETQQQVAKCSFTTHSDSTRYSGEAVVNRLLHHLTVAIGAWN